MLNTQGVIKYQTQKTQVSRRNWRENRQRQEVEGKAGRMDVTLKMKQEFANQKPKPLQYLTTVNEQLKPRPKTWSNFADL